MTIEEKAKRYDEAYKVAEFIHRFSSNPAEIKRMEEIFPALKESEDERIRGAIIDHLKDNNLTEWAVWLEKQGEQKQDPCEHCKDCVKNADKVEPKFHQGDWIVFNGLVLLIKEVVPGYYRTISIGGIPNSYDWDIDNLARLWTIQDAKDGDVLQLGEVTVIFKKYIGQEKCICYCSISEDGGFEIPIENGEDNIYGCTDTTPATKEQREQLEKAMADARYTFDFDKKELKKIEQNPAWSEEDEKMLNQVIEDIIKLAGPYVCYHKDIDWLKSIKDRIQSKQDLNEEDEEMRLDAIKYLEIFDAQGIHGDKAIPAINWLKSLRPHNHWKPSDEQIRELGVVATGKGWFSKEILSGLLEQLKKLREE